MKTRRKTLLLSMRTYVHKAGINSVAEDRTGKGNSTCFVVSGCNNDWNFSAERINWKGSDSEDKMIVVGECQSSRQFFIF